MSFRVEQKIPASIYEIEQLYALLTGEGMKPLYPSRTISSIYFDTPTRQLHYDSEEGMLPRRKIRIRHYLDDTSSDFFLETKISSVEGRHKVSKKISDATRQSFLTHGILNPQYGLIVPFVIVTYRREYCSKDDIRITFDRNIHYKKFYKPHFSVNDPQQVLEIKAPDNTDLNFIDEFLSHPRHRFSKFSNAMNLLTSCTTFSD